MPQTLTDAPAVEDLTIRELFALPPQHSTELVAGLKAEEFKQLEKKLSSLSEPIPWSRLQTEVANVLSGALNTSVLDAWATAWKKYEDVKAGVEESRNSPDAIVLTRLAEHTVESALHPYVEVLLGPTTIEKIIFDVTLTSKISGLIIGLKNGCLVSLQVGQCEWSGGIASRGLTLVKRNLAKLDLPGRITLKRGIPLTSDRTP